MFPVALNLSVIRVLLTGQGELLEKRRKQLEEAGAVHITAINTIPSDEAIFRHSVIMVAGLDYDTSKVIADAARAAGKLVNVEDVNDLCDFYFTANVRRGDLVIAVSTSGASPTLARRMRDYIARRFGAEWADILGEIKTDRLRLRAEGKTMKEVMQASDALIEKKGWLDCKGCKQKDAA